MMMLHLGTSNPTQAGDPDVWTWLMNSSSWQGAMNEIGAHGGVIIETIIIEILSVKKLSSNLSSVFMMLSKPAFGRSLYET